MELRALRGSYVWRSLKNNIVFNNLYAKNPENIRSRGERTKDFLAIGFSVGRVSGNSTLAKISFFKSEGSSRFPIFAAKSRRNSTCVHAKDHVERLHAECGGHGLHFHRVVGLKSKRGGYIVVTWVGSRGLWMNRHRARVWEWMEEDRAFSLTCEQRVWEGSERVTRRRIGTDGGARGRKDYSLCRTIPYTYET